MPKFKAKKDEKEEKFPSILKSFKSTTSLQDNFQKKSIATKKGPVSLIFKKEES